MEGGRPVLTFVACNGVQIRDHVLTQRPLAVVFEANLFGPVLPVLYLDVVGTHVLVSGVSSIWALVFSITGCVCMRNVLILSLLMTEPTVARLLTLTTPVRFTFPHSFLHEPDSGRE